MSHRNLSSRVSLLERGKNRQDRPQRTTRSAEIVAWPQPALNVVCPASPGWWTMLADSDNQTAAQRTRRLLSCTTCGVCCRGCTAALESRQAEELLPTCMDSPVKSGVRRRLNWRRVRRLDAPPATTCVTHIAAIEAAKTTVPTLRDGPLSSIIGRTAMSAASQRGSLARHTGRTHRSIIMAASARLTRAVPPVEPLMHLPRPHQPRPSGGSLPRNARGQKSKEVRAH